MVVNFILFACDAPGIMPVIKLSLSSTFFNSFPPKKSSGKDPLIRFVPNTMRYNFDNLLTPNGIEPLKEFQGKPKATAIVRSFSQKTMLHT